MLAMFLQGQKLMMLIKANMELKTLFMFQLD